MVRSWIVLAAAVTLAATSCALNPATGKRQFSLIGQGDEVALGTEADQQTLREMTLYGSPELQAYVQDLGARLAAVSERPDLRWTFRLVDDPTVNAFALPGGFIYVTRGLMAHMNSEAELAGVLGHEIGHVTARHSVSQMSKQQMFSLGLGVGTVLSDTVAELGEALSQGLGLLFLKFSRDDEREADDLGLRYLHRAGYDPRPMTSIYETLGAVAGLEGGQKLPDWQSTHPAPEDRRERMARAVADLGVDSEAGMVRRDEYLRRLEGMVYGDDPREGYFDADVFLHPGLKFRVDLPPTWARRNLRDALVLQSPQADAAAQLTLTNATTPSAAAEAFFARQGVRRGAVKSERLHGLDTVTGDFELGDATQSLLGEVTFAAHGGKVYQLAGFGRASAWGARREAARIPLRSFRPLTDATVLAVEPARIRIVRIERAMSLEEFQARHPSSAAPERIAVLNHVPVEGRLEAGTSVKRVVGGVGAK